MFEQVAGVFKISENKKNYHSPQNLARGIGAMSGVPFPSKTLNPGPFCLSWMTTSVVIVKKHPRSLPLREEFNAI